MCCKCSGTSEHSSFHPVSILVKAETWKQKSNSWSLHTFILVTTVDSAHAPSCPFSHFFTKSIYSSPILSCTWRSLSAGHPSILIPSHISPFIYSVLNRCVFPIGLSFISSPASPNPILLFSGAFNSIFYVETSHQRTKPKNVDFSNVEGRVSLLHVLFSKVFDIFSMASTWFSLLLFMKVAKLPPLSSESIEKWE